MHIIDVYNRFPISIVCGEGVYIYDDYRKPYLDFTSGLGAVGLGHSHPYLVEKLQNQLTKLWHCSNLFHIPEQELFAKRLTEATFADNVFFCSSGLEAVETLIKVTRRYFYVNDKQTKYRIITLKDGFHGRSIACISAGGNAKSKEGYKPLLDGFDIVEKNDISAIKNAITTNTAAILVEPIQAEGGVNALDTNYLQQLRKIANENEILLCFDEVQCGYGRTGTLFHYQNIGVEPDILSAAKSMGNGFPLAGCLMKKKIAAVMTRSSHGSTYGGNPMAMVVGNAVLDIMLEKDFFTKINTVSEYLFKKLTNLKEQFPFIISDIVGKGMILGIVFNSSSYAEKFILACLKHGLALTRTSKATIIRILPPLVIEKEHVDTAYQIMLDVIHLIV